MTTVKLKAIIVIPCFNESLRLKATCHSLGFGRSKLAFDSDDILIIVNNNSTDDTLLVAHEIKMESQINSVHVISEYLQGHVPARHAGNLYAKELCILNSWNLDKIVIIQADADTFYSKNYIQSVKRASSFFGNNTIIEASSTYPLLFKLRNKAFLDLCNMADSKFLFLTSNSKSYDVIVDDKAASYRLVDYFSWGGYSREFFSSGEEILAETSRLFIRAKACNARKIILKSAYNIHSVRRITSEPVINFVTAGFPREGSFTSLWSSYNLTMSDLVRLPQSDPKIWKSILRERYMHFIGLFFLLPFHIKKTKLEIQMVTNKLEKFSTRWFAIVLSLIDNLDLR